MNFSQISTAQQIKGAAFSPQNRPNFLDAVGVCADCPDLDRLPVLQPILSSTGKSFVTHNSFGFDIIEREGNWVTDAILKSLCEDSLFLDIGAGYGLISREALGKGALVISNDISTEQLLWSRSQTDPDMRSRMSLNNQPFPNLEIFNDPCPRLTHILAHRVFHFLSGREIEQGLINCYQALQTGGQLGIVVMSASHPKFKDQFYAEYLERRDAGVLWPGEWLDVARHLPDQQYALPEKLHVFDSAELSKAVERSGFRVEKIDFVSLVNFGQASDGRNGTEAIGLIAVKP